ncbi:hypothetical protein DFQ30_007125 [Apophysomyces sp. BC1015]|nr:hypothetical protein DFQ30_007125 [Apophysomyces sp. BC1015]KAG0176426.1 hypothetical protein DFQ29_006155 [Apophysomyces sp. BC1021]
MAYFYRLFSKLISSITFYTAIILLFFLWIVKDYPAWRCKQIIGDTQTQGEQQTSSVVSKDDEKRKSSAMDEKMSEEDSELTLAHYIMVTPMAVLYIIGRALLDMVRFCVFRFLWHCERMVPKLDAWLFEQVTVWLPAKAEQIETWWAMRGVHVWHSAQTYVCHTALPAVGQILETAFLCLCKVFNVLQHMAIHLHAAWQWLQCQRDWKQLVRDIADGCHSLCWDPCVWFLSRLYRLASLFFKGCRHTLVALRDDVRWLAAATSDICDSILATALFRSSCGAATWIYTNAQRVLVYFVSLSQPIWIFLCVIFVKAVDRVIEVLQSKAFQRHWLDLRRATCSYMVWTICETFDFVDTIQGILGIGMRQFLQPSVVLFTKFVLPQLSDGYRRCVAYMDGAFRRYLFPVWVWTTMYLEVPLATLSRWTVNVSQIVCVHALQMGNHMWERGQHIAAAVMVLARWIVARSGAAGHFVYSKLTESCMEHAPVLAQKISQWTGQVIMSLDWVGLQRDSLLIMEALQEGVSAQLNLLFMSLERTFGTWANEPTKGSDNDLKTMN